MEVEIGNSAKAKAYIESISNGYAMGIIKSKTFTNETSDGRISFQITWEEN